MGAKAPFFQERLLDVTTWLVANIIYILYDVSTAFRRLQCVKNMLFVTYFG